MTSPHIPDTLPPANLDYARLILPVSQARAALAAHDARLLQFQFVGIPEPIARDTH
jgi:hypothetical protein